ncbi:cytochrome bd-I ubiquinol oxidase subunit 1 apoprotein [Syntrophus gentianae]|uniref:Cytochrome bd-I ubiquinol oxidase subunit 1 apoprotein n=1 Tax=Syntrophus gentianae TaxID=43775 RepID=A0A1H7ZJJ4_9BACT|nr:cytochrome ubiquinol oxidase subunit I [Syntrophus gentianae]SEM58496.1 cytochrome bd-I ubiquinol oxidase subunit 1 apoprotein [Syntrophus gentianae]
MDVLSLSRLQFAMTAGFHFIFVPLTLGLSLLVAFMESRYVISGNPLYLRMTRFWGRLFLINFALGLVTGLTLEFQFGMNWAAYSRFVGDIFGSPLAIEATAAFFLESVFIGLWIFGWNRLSPRMHAFAMWMVALGTNLSALWILLANGWMQFPVGFVLRNSRAEMVDFIALFTSPYGWLKFLHTITAGYVTAAFFVLGISAWHLLKGREIPFFKASFRMAAIFGLASSLAVVGIGDFHGAEVGRVQPVKLAAMEALWDTQSSVPFYLLIIPDQKNERNRIEAVGIPYMVSFLAYRDIHAEVKGLKDFPKEDRPPVGEVFFSFRFMVAVGGLFILLTAAALYLSVRNRLESFPRFLWLMVLSIPLPYLASQAGWIVAEVGRQPWIVYGLLRTKDAVSPNIAAGQVMFSLIGFGLLYSLLGLVWLYLLIHHARKGPEPEISAANPTLSTAKPEV